jgi:hypothetical protein
LPDLVELLNRGFENYFIPIQFNLSAFLTMLRKDSVNLSVSRVLFVDKENLIHNGINPRLARSVKRNLSSFCFMSC